MLKMKGKTVKEEEKWAAYDDPEKKDGRYDGQFYIAVKTTGIYCLPSCPARAPLRKNIRLLDTMEECVREGFRACKRCKPDPAQR